MTTSSGVTPAVPDSSGSARPNDPDAAADDAPDADNPYKSNPGYAWVSLSVLFTVYVFNFIDRQILSILAQSIKEDLQISDTALGFLGGIAFAIFYTFLGVPIARLADKGSRRNILAICLAIWSGMTVLCGFAQNFWHLLAARIGVAVGEAGGSPPSHSMISDMFPPSRRATALGIYALGIPVGSMIGNLVGGWANEAFDWRTAFMLVGFPGLLLAVGVRLFLKEPPRGGSEGLKVKEGDAPPVMDVFKYLWGLRSFRFMSLGAALHAFVGYGVGLWIPPFFERSHGWTSGTIGTWLFFLGFAGMAGTFLGGYMGDWMARRFDQRWYVWLPGVATLLSVPFAAYTYASDVPEVALLVYIIPTLLGSYYLGPTFSMTQGLVGLRMRALAASILLFVLNIIGLGLGPQFVGVASDLFNNFTDLGDESLRAALLLVLVFNVISAGLYLKAGKTLGADLARSGEMS